MYNCTTIHTPRMCSTMGSIMYVQSVKDCLHRLSLGQHGTCIIILDDLIHYDALYHNRRQQVMGQGCKWNIIVEKYVLPVKVHVRGGTWYRRRYTQLLLQIYVPFSSFTKLHSLRVAMCMPLTEIRYFSVRLVDWKVTDQTRLVRTVSLSPIGWLNQQ